MASANRQSALEALEHASYAGTHWLASFAVYLETRADDVRPGRPSAPDPAVTATP